MVSEEKIQGSHLDVLLSAELHNIEFNVSEYFSHLWRCFQNKWKPMWCVAQSQKTRSGKLHLSVLNWEF